MAATKIVKSYDYRWEGIDKHGDRVKGSQSSSSISLLRIELRRRGISPKKIRKQAKPLFSFSKDKITVKDITLFTRQLATMINAGIPLVKSFDIVSRGTDKDSLREMINTIKADVESGTTFADALAKHPNYFNDIYCNLVGAGEQSGSLSTMLERIATYKEKLESLKAKIKKALVYPSMVVLVAIIVTVALLVFVVPQFESMFKGYGADLPAFTALVVTLSEFCQSNGLLIFGGFSLGGYAFMKAKKRSKAFQILLEKLLLRIPVIGLILKKAAIARFAQTLSITFAAGLPLVDALKTVSGATGNNLYLEATLRIREEVATGTEMYVAMQATGLFPNMVVQMIAIGEESGSLESMLTKVATIFEEEVDNAVDNLSTLLEPMIMIILGTLVGGLVVAMYLPIFKLGNII